MYSGNVLPKFQPPSRVSSFLFLGKKKLGSPELGRRLRYDQKYPVVIVEFHNAIDLVQVMEKPMNSLGYKAADVVDVEILGNIQQSCHIRQS